LVPSKEGRAGLSLIGKWELCLVPEELHKETFENMQEFSHKYSFPEIEVIAEEGERKVLIYLHPYAVNDNLSYLTAPPSPAPPRAQIPSRLNPP
jgi:hypothetical protein